MAYQFETAWLFGFDASSRGSWLNRSLYIVSYFYLPAHLSRVSVSRITFNYVVIATNDVNVRMGL